MEYYKSNINILLYKYIRRDPIVVLDEALYFQATTVTYLTHRDDIAFVTFPSYSPESILSRSAVDYSKKP